jgi:hypothetical protein
MEQLNSTDSFRRNQISNGLTGIQIMKLIQMINDSCFKEEDLFQKETYFKVPRY